MLQKTLAAFGGLMLAFATPAAARFYLRAGWALSGAAGIFFSAVAVGLARNLLVGGLVQNL